MMSDYPDLYLHSEEIRLTINENSDSQNEYAGDVNSVQESDAGLFIDGKNEDGCDLINMAYDPDDVTTNESVVTENISDLNFNFCQTCNWEQNDNFEAFDLLFNESDSGFLL